MLFAGYRKCDITPSLGTPCALGLDNEAEEVFEPIFVRALVVGDGTTVVALLSFDLIGLNRREVEALRARLSDETGIPAAQIILHATHTHQSPNVGLEFGEFLAPRGLRSYEPAYWQRVCDGASAAIRRAASSQVGCRVWYGEAPAQGIASNRRLRQPDGSVILRSSRDSEATRRYPEGHIDPLARVISFRRLDGREILVQSYGCHPTASGGDEAPYVTADFPGYSLGAVESRAERSDGLHLTGPCGDVNPGKYTGWRGRKEDAEAMGEALAKAVIAGRGKAETLDAEPLAFRTEQVRLPLRADLPTESELAARVEEDIAAYQAAKERGETLPGGGPLRGSLHRLLARRDAPDGFLTTEVAGLALGELLLVFLPGECFLELGHVIRYHYAHRGVVIAEGCDYSPGYIPVPEAYQAGGYEPQAAIIGPEGFAALARAACELF